MKGAWYAIYDETEDRVFLESDDFRHDVRLLIDGDFASVSDKYDYAQGIANQLNETVS